MRPWPAVIKVETPTSRGAGKMWVSWLLKDVGVLAFSWKSRHRGRPRIDPEIRQLIRRMCRANPLWGAPRIHGELLKLGIDVSEATVSKYMIKRRGPPSQTWRTFLANHAKDIIALDFFTVPKQLSGFFLF